MKNELIQIDCMEYMKDIPDNHFDLGIVDPPYFEEYGKKIYTGGSISTTGIKRFQYESKEWKVPDREYFKELYRISKNQIIWGCNYYAQYIPHVSRIVWDKNNDSSSFSKCELASKSFNIGIEIFRYTWNGMIQQNMKNKETRIHPTQKPVALYKWLLTNYAKPGDKLFDSHSGSGSFRIAAYDMGFDLVSCELDADYCRENEARFQNHIKQNELFKPEEIQKNIYTQGEL